jgi:hypothetical protein
VILGDYLSRVLEVTETIFQLIFISLYFEGIFSYHAGIAIKHFLNLEKLVLFAVFSLSICERQPHDIHPSPTPAMHN